MVTPKQWKEFNNYRDKVHKEVTESEEWKKIGERFDKIKLATEKKVVKKSFLGYQWEEEVLPSLGTIMWGYDAMEWTLRMYEILLCKVPPKTVEACLDWLSLTKD